MKKTEGRKHKEEPSGNFKTEKYNTQNFKFLAWTKQENKFDGGKKSVNLKIKQQRLTNLNNRQKIYWGEKHIGVQEPVNSNKRCIIHITRVPERKEKE